jgi:uncharacterized protein YggE
MAQAQAQTRTPQTSTTLELSVTGAATHAPDATTASLTAEATAPSAAAAQQAVNVLVAHALQAAHAVPGLAVTTSNYSVSPVYPEQKTWRAQQGLELSQDAAPQSQAAKPMLKLIGSLQHDGLTLQNLTGKLSPKAQREAKNTAIADAVKRLKTQTEIVAAALGDQLGAITALRLNVATPVFPLLRAGSMAMAESAPPSISAAPVAEHVTLSGTVTLTRRNR